MSRTDFYLVRGDTFKKRLTFLDADDVAIDVSGYTFTGQVREDPDDETALADFTFDTTDAATGIVDAIIAAEDTADFPFPFVHYDIQYANDAGEITTAPRGRLRMIKDVTRA